MYPHPTQQEFYDKLNKMDEEGDSSMILVYCACALSGLIVGLIFGYLIGILL